MDLSQAVVDINKRFILSKKKKQDQFVNIILEQANSELNTWRNSLVNNLSDKLSKKAQHRLRYPRTRLFPYMNSGKLSESIWFSTEAHVTEKSAVVHINVNNLASGDVQDLSNEHGEKHGWFTNKGIRAPKSEQEGAWVGWVNDVFTGSGRGNVKSLKDIFNNLHKTRRAI